MGKVKVLGTGWNTKINRYVAILTCVVNTVLYAFRYKAGIL